MSLSSRDYKYEISKLRSDLAAVKFSQTMLRLMFILQKFRPDQLRVPAANPGAGQWALEKDKPRSNIQPAFLVPAAPIVIEKTIELGLMLYTYMAARNAVGRQAVVKFNSKDFKPSSGNPLDLDSVGSLTKGEVDAICPRFGEVKTRTDLAAERAVRIGDYPSAAAYGTAVHKDLSDQIKELADPNLRSEVSYLKSREADKYGQTGSVRIDVLERVGDASVCVYDIKTGVSGLGAARTGEIAQRVFAAYPETQRIIVTEIRPTR